MTNRSIPQRDPSGRPTKTIDPKTVAVVTALGLNGKCGDQTPYRAFLEGLRNDLWRLHRHLDEDAVLDTDVTELAKQLIERVSAFLMAEPEIAAYGREFYRVPESHGSAGDAASPRAPDDTSTTAPNDASRRTSETSSPPGGDTSTAAALDASSTPAYARDLEVLRRRPSQIEDLWVEWGRETKATLRGIVTTALGASNDLQALPREALQQTAVDLAVLGDLLGLQGHEDTDPLSAHIVQAFVRGIGNRAHAAAALAFKLELLHDEELAKAKSIPPASGPVARATKPVTPIPDMEAPDHG